jgi:hypothetical protein
MQFFGVKTGWESRFNKFESMGRLMPNEMIFEMENVRTKLTKETMHESQN